MGKISKVKTKIPLYFGDLIIFIGKDLGEIDKKYNLKLRKHLPDGFNCYEALSVRLNKGKGYTRYGMIIKPDSKPSVIAHEALHLVHMVFFDRSIDIDLENDEPEAYLLGWIIEQTYNALKSK